MPEKKISFEDNLKKLNTIVDELESGNVPLDQALDKFKTGVKLSSSLQKKLNNADAALAHVMSNSKEKPYSRDKNGQDVNNDADANDDKD